MQSSITSLPPAMRIPFSSRLGSPLFVFRSISRFHSYPGVRSRTGRVCHSGSGRRILRRVIIAWSWVSGGISATATTLVTIASRGVCVGCRMDVSGRHNRLRGSRVGDLRRRIWSLAGSVGRVRRAVGRGVVERSILGPAVRTLGVGVHIGLCRGCTESGRGWSLGLADLMPSRCRIVGDRVRGV